MASDPVERKTPAQYLEAVTPKMLAECDNGGTLDRVLDELREAFEDAYRERPYP